MLGSLPLLSHLKLAGGTAPPPGPPLPSHERPLLPSLTRLDCSEWSVLHAVMRGTRVSSPPVCSCGPAGPNSRSSLIVLRRISQTWLSGVLQHGCEGLPAKPHYVLSDDNDVHAFAAATRSCGYGSSSLSTRDKWVFVLGKGIGMGAFQQVMEVTAYHVNTVTMSSLGYLARGELDSWAGDLQLTTVHIDTLLRGRSAASQAAGRGGVGKRLQLHDCRELTDAALVALVGPELEELRLDQAAGVSDEGLREVGVRCPRLKLISLLGVTASVTAAGLVQLLGAAPAAADGGDDEVSKEVDVRFEGGMAQAEVVMEQLAELVGVHRSNGWRVLQSLHLTESRGVVIIFTNRR
jgi:hypothetical protein